MDNTAIDTPSCEIDLSNLPVHRRAPLRRALEFAARAPAPRAAEDAEQCEEQLRAIADEFFGALFPRVLQRAVRSAAVGDAARDLVRHRPRRRRSDGLATVNVRTSRGPTVPVTTPYYREKHARRAQRRPGLYPALVVLGIYDRCTPKLASDASRAVAMLSSLAEAQAQLRYDGIDLDIKTLRATAYRSAARARVAQQSAAGGLLDRVTGKRVVVSLDGGRVRGRRKKRGPKTKTGRNRFHTDWKEPKLLILYVGGADGRPAQTWAPIIDGTRRGPEAVVARRLSYARQIGLHAADTVLFIADGAPWIWQRIQRLIATLGLSPTQVLGLIDFSHAAKQLSDAVKLRRWSVKQRTRWLNRTRGLLKRNCLAGRKPQKQGLFRRDWTKPVASGIVAWMRVFGLTFRKRVKELETENSGLRREIEQKDAEIARLEKSHKRLQHEQQGLQHERERLAREQERLRQERDRLKHELETARRARKRQAAPFSKGKPKPAPKKAGRKGGPKYGPKRRRDIPAQVDEELDVRLPDGCPTCFGAIDHDRVEDQYQEEIVRRVQVTRFRVHIGHCAACGARVQGRHPRQTSDATGAAAQVGPEALAFATVLNKEFGLSYGKTVAVLQRGFGLTLTPGGLSQALARLAARCAPTYERLKQVVRTQPSVTMDETGWRIGGHPAWLHVAATADATVYGIFPGRGFDEAAALIGADYDGFLVRDGWPPYRGFEAAYHQTCTRHLIHRCDALIRQATPAGAVFPGQVQELLQQGLRLRDRYAADTVSAHGLAVAVGRLEAQLARLLDRPFRLADNRRLANHLTVEFDALFTYLRCPGLEATNYRGEQAVRPAVVTRKVWGGNRTTTGAHTQEVLTSVLRTSHQQDKDPVPRLVALLRSPRPYVLDLDLSRASPS